MRKLLFLCLLLAFISCKQSPQISHAMYHIPVDSLSTGFPPLAKLSYIPLETKDSSLIGSINKVLFRNHTFYIFDSENKKIFLFDENGKFLQVIERVGQGPGEYLYPSDMDVDMDGNIYISDFYAKSVIKYRKGNETDFEILNIGNSFMDFAIENEIVYMSRIAKTTTFDINIARWNNQTKGIEILKENKLPEGNKIPYANHYLYRSGNGVCYYERFHPMVYRVTEDSLYEYISFHSEDFPTTDNIKKYNTLPLEKKYELHTWDVNACYETEKYIILEFYTGMEQTYCLINKETKEMYRIHSLPSIGVLGYGIHALAENDFVSFFRSDKGNIKRAISVIPENDKINRELMRTVTEDDNPVLVRFSFE